MKRQACLDREKVSVPEFVRPGRGVFFQIIIDENSQRDAFRWIVLAVELLGIAAGQGPKPRCRTVIKLRLAQTKVPQETQSQHNGVTTRSEQYSTPLLSSKDSDVRFDADASIAGPPKLPPCGGAENSEQLQGWRNTRP